MAEMPKVFKTIDEQIELLIKRGVVINNRDYAGAVLKSENYYSVINGYKDLFLTTTSAEDHYIKGTTFEEITALYKLDRRLREILLIELLRVEKNISTHITYTFSKYHGYDNHIYLKSTSFNVKNENNAKLTQKLIDKINDIINEYSSKHKAISYYLQTHKYISLWVLATVFSFGTLNYFYSRMLFAEKREIANIFNLKPKQFEAALDLLCSFRNKCAHGDRIYTYKKDIIKSRFIPVLKYHTDLKIQTNEKGPKYGREDVLALLIILKYFINAKRYNYVIDAIDDELNKLAKQLKVINIEKVVHVMGFVENWKDLKSL